MWLGAISIFSGTGLSFKQFIGTRFTVAPYTFEQALRFGRELEKLNYYWYEEPLYDENFHGLRELPRILDITIIGTELIEKPHYSVAEVISTRVVDMVRTDVCMSGGITPTIKTARLAESFGVQC